MLKLKSTFWLLSAFQLFSFSAFAQLGFRNAWDRDAWDWAKRQVPGVGGSVSGSSYQSSTRFMLSLRATGLRKLIARANIYLGDQTNAVWCPIIHNYGYDTPTNLGPLYDNLVAFVTNDFSEATGLTGNGSTKHIKTGVGGSTLLCAVNSMHFAIYSRTSVYEVGATHGANPTAGGYLNYFQFGWSDNKCYTTFSAGSKQESVSDPSPPTGFYLGTRTGQTDRKVYKNGAQLLTSSTDCGTTPVPEDQLIYIHAINNNNTVNSPTTRALCYYSIGLGIPATKQAIYYGIVQRLQLDKNRAIVP